MSDLDDNEWQQRVAQRLEQLGSVVRDLSYLTRLEVLVVLGGLSLAALLVLLVALTAALLRWLF